MRKIFAVTILMVMACVSFAGVYDTRYVYVDGSNASAAFLAAVDALSTTDFIIETEIDTMAEIEAIVGSANIIVATEIDTLAELEALMGTINILQSTEMDTESEFEALVSSINFIVSTEMDTESEVEALMGALNIIVSTEIDTLTELETIMSSINIIQGTEIDTLTELETLMSAINIIQSTEIDTIAEVNAIIGDITALIHSTTTEYVTLTDDSNADSLHEHSVEKYGDTADGTIDEYRLVQIDASGDLVEGTLQSERIVGANADNAQKTAAQAIDVAYGLTIVTSATPVDAGQYVKCADDGRVTELITAGNTETVIDTGAATGFTNQPANDGVSIHSDGADTTQTVTIIGTTNGTDTIVVETINLNAGSVIPSIKVDWGEIIGVRLSAVCAGTVTVEETSANADITTITTGNLTSGINEVPTADQGAFGVAPRFWAAGASTKQVGFKYLATDGTTVAYVGDNLNGTTHETATVAAMLVTEWYDGDCDAVTTIAVGAAEDEMYACGKAYQSATARGDNIRVLLIP